jgi:hypothetical protein
MKLIVILLCLIIFIIGVSNLYLYYFIPRPNGLSGTKGIQGKKGDPGDTGDIGSTGLTGYRGPIGIKGKDIGLQGKRGNYGIRGITGESGDKGKIGLKGDKGDEGPPGIKGEKGYTGKKGLEGRSGAPRPITNINPFILSADKNKCVQIYADHTELKCPSNMAIFDIKAKKNSYKTANSEIEKIICCKIQIQNQFSQSYFDKTNILINLPTKFGAIIAQLKAYDNSYIPGNEMHEYIKEYDESQRQTIRRNIDTILILISGIQNKMSIREIPLDNLTKLLGNENLAKQKIIYTEDEIRKIIDISGSINSYEWYILNLMNGLITLRQRAQETTIDTTNYKRLIKEIYDFPKNDIEALEKVVKI